MDRIRTPQFRTELIRRLKNLFPGWEPEFLEVDGDGLSFRMKDERGRYYGEVVYFRRYREGLLRRQALLREVLGALH